MSRLEIPFNELDFNTFKIWNDSLLLTPGENAPGKFNSMIIGWGSIGIMWKKPMIQVVVRPSRYTYEFIEKYDTFTVCAFNPEYKKALSVFGTKSGRDTDKVKESGFTPCPSINIAAPGYEEAALILECRKTYFDDFRPERISEETKKICYNSGDFHRAYFGEIVAAYGTESFRK